jgi:alcohol dehydrogenase
MIAFSHNPEAILPAFQTARLPHLVFGSGTIAQLPEWIEHYAKRALLVTGRRSFYATPRWADLSEALARRGITFETFTVSGEPSPELVDQAVAQFHGQGIEAVVGIGGGSALDAAKAIAGLLPRGHSVMDYLEGVGPELAYSGPSLPFIAVPTTAGTGSEATKNAVLSRRGPEGFKKSFRHELLVAQVALVDPDLLATCPRGLIAADGMDAFTQLLESYVSLKAEPLTDALALSGLQAFNEGFWGVWENTGETSARLGRSRLAYASLLSGICLAQTGLGSVHGLASPLGAFFPAPHGEVCGTLVAEATAMNLRALRERLPDSSALPKYAEIGRLLSGQAEIDEVAGQNRLVELLRQWTEKLGLPRLRDYGMSEADIPRVVANSRGSSMKTNPLALTDAEIAEVLKARL